MLPAVSASFLSLTARCAGRQALIRSFLRDQCAGRGASTPSVVAPRLHAASPVLRTGLLLRARLLLQERPTPRVVRCRVSVGAVQTSRASGRRGGARRRGVRSGRVQSDLRALARRGLAAALRVAIKRPQRDSTAESESRGRGRGVAEREFENRWPQAGDSSLSRGVMPRPRPPGINPARKEQRRSRRERPRRTSSKRNVSEPSDRSGR